MTNWITFIAALSATQRFMYGPERSATSKSGRAASAAERCSAVRLPPAMVLC
jgi:hypothetical protein